MSVHLHYARVVFLTLPHTFTSVLWIWVCVNEYSSFKHLLSVKLVKPTMPSIQVLVSVWVNLCCLEVLNIHALHSSNHILVYSEPEFVYTWTHTHTQALAVFKPCHSAICHRRVWHLLEYKCTVTRDTCWSNQVFFFPVFRSHKAVLSF